MLTPFLTLSGWGMVGEGDLSSTVHGTAGNMAGMRGREWQLSL